MQNRSSQSAPGGVLVQQAHALDAGQVMQRLDVTMSGLSAQQITQRRAQYGANALPRKPPPGLFEVFVV